MLRQLKNQLNGTGGNRNRYGGDTLPATSLGRTPSSRWNPLSRPSGHVDGSAAAIDTVPQFQKTWQRTSAHTRTSWITVLCSVVMVWLGWRYISYYSGGIHIDCHSVTCDVKLRPIGWGKSVHITEVARHQLLSTMAIKATKDGTFVTDQNIVLLDPYRADAPKKKEYKKSASYKGPDEDGNYLSYAIIWRDAKDEPVNDPSDTMVPDANLQRMIPFVDVISNPNPPSQTANNSQVDDDGYSYYRLTPQKFGVRESKRRVRTMIQKLESYMKHRRQKLVVRENAPPAWQGVMLMVVGAMSFFIALALGQFSDFSTLTPRHGGPGMRRPPKRPHYTDAPARPKPRDTIQESYQVSTPSQYEVRTTSSPMPSGGAGPRSAHRRR